MYIYFVRSSLSIDEILAMLPRTLVVAPHFGIARILSCAYLLAHKSFYQGKGVAKKFELEWLLKLAAAHSIQRALAFCLPRGEEKAIASLTPIKREALERIGKPFKPRVSVRRLALRYGISKAALRRYQASDLICERLVVASLD